MESLLKEEQKYQIIKKCIAPYFVLDNGAFGVIYKLASIDSERVAVNDYYHQVLRFIKQLPDGWDYKFHLKSEYKHDLGEPFYRKELIDQYGYRKVDLYFSICKRNSITNAFKAFKSDEFYNSNIEKLLRTVSLANISFCGSEPEIIVPDECPFFEKEYLSISVKNGHIYNESESKYVSVFNLFTQNKENDCLVDVDYLAKSFKSLPFDLEHTFSFSKVSDNKSLLNTFLKNKKFDNAYSYADQTKKHKYEELADSQENENLSIWNISSVFIIKDDTLKGLAEKNRNFRNTMSFLGKFKEEQADGLDLYFTVGPGHQPPYEILETIKALPAFIPIYLGTTSNLIEDRGSMVLHREDHSLDSFTCFSSSLSASVGIVIGSSGLGKSVFLNTLVGSLNKDERNKVFILDVEGTHTSLVSNLGGQIFELDKNKESNLNPFSLIGRYDVSETAEVISDYISSIISGGEYLAQVERAKIENQVVSYIKTHPISPSLDGFIEFHKENIFNIESLLRFSSQGLYKNLCAGILDSKSQLDYFNFSTIKTANKKELTGPVISSLMGLLYKALSDKTPDQRVLIIVDEAKFFIKENFSSLLMLAKNVRKIGGSLLICAQKTSDLIIDGNLSLVEDSNFNVLFSIDKVSKEILKINEEHFEVFNQKSKDAVKKDAFRQFLLINENGQRVINHYLTDEEYFLSANEPREKEIISEVEQILNLDHLSARKVLAYAKSL